MDKLIFCWNFAYITAQILPQPFPNVPGQFQPQLFPNVPGQILQPQPFQTLPGQIQPQPFQNLPPDQFQPQQIPNNNLVRQLQQQNFQNPNFQSGLNGPIGNLQTCSGSNQLPLIDIHRTDLIYDTSIDPLIFENYGIPVTGSIVNDGRSVRIDLNGRGPKIGLGNYQYNLQQMAFYWSKIDNAGSQHLFNGQSFPLELQMLHTRDVMPLGQNLFNSPDMLIVTVLFDSLHEPSVFFGENRELSKITNQLLEIDSQGRTTLLREPIIAQNFLPQDSNSYVRYTGSPTTPPCAANVEWIVMTHTLYVSDTQLLMFRRLQTINLQPLPPVSNFIAGASLIDIQPNVRLLQNAGEARTFKVHNDLGYLNDSSTMFSFNCNFCIIFISCILICLFQYY